VLALTAAVAGCNRGPRVVKVTGTVTRGGKPMPGVLLKFVPDGTARPSWGVSDDDGHYELKYDLDRGNVVPGAVIGHHRVYVEFRARSMTEQQQKKPKDAAAILDKYGNIDKSPLNYDVTTDNQVIDVKLD
jgi:hypothetical protein